MSEHDISDKLAIQLLPSVRIAVASEKKEVVESARSQKYGKLAISYPDSNIGVAKFYNKIIEETKETTDIFVFLNDYTWFNNSNSLSLLVESFIKNGSRFPIVYGDSIRVEDKFEVCEYLPGYTPGLLFGHLVLNNSFAVAAKVLPPNPFNEKLEYIYFFDLMRKVGYQHILYHIAEPIFRVKRIGFDLERELRLLNE